MPDDGVYRVGPALLPTCRHCGKEYDGRLAKKVIDERDSYAPVSLVRRRRN